MFSYYYFVGYDFSKSVFVQKYLIIFKIKVIYRFENVSKPISFISFLVKTKEAFRIGEQIYPKARRDNTSDIFFGTTVSDPYRWLEDPYSEETKQFIMDQNEITSDFISDNEWIKISEQIVALSNYSESYIPWQVGDYYFIDRNNGSQSQKYVCV